MHDAVTELQFSFVIPQDHPALAGHFPGNPIVPGVVILDQVLLGLKSHAEHFPLRLAQVKFQSMLRPEEKACVLYRFSEHQCHFSISTMAQSSIKILASGIVTLA